MNNFNKTVLNNNNFVNSNKNLLTNFIPSVHFHNEPFPHIAINECLNIDIYEKLENNFPKFKNFCDKKEFDLEIPLTISYKNILENKYAI